MIAYSLIGIKDCRWETDCWHEYIILNGKVLVAFNMIPIGDFDYLTLVKGKCYCSFGYNDETVTAYTQIIPDESDKVYLLQNTEENRILFDLDKLDRLFERGKCK